MLQFACLASSILLAGIASAEITISDGETVLFEETFDDNSNGWSNIEDTDSGASISDGTWSAYSAVSGENVTSTLTFDTAIDLTDGDVSVYFSASVASRWYSYEYYGINLTGSDSQAGYVIQAGANGYFTYTDSDGVDRSAWGTDEQYVYSTGFIDYKFTISYSGQDEDGTDVYTGSFYVWSSDDNDYSLVYTTVDYMYFDEGLIEDITLYIKNTSTTVAFDEVVVTQSVPEPSTAALLLGLTGLSLVVVRRRHRV
jgi:hypothetical protein